MIWSTLESEARSRHLFVLGGFHPDAEDDLPGDVQTLVLLGPNEPEFWSGLQSSPEWHMADPVDAWSKRVIDAWAAEINAIALYPFGPPPYRPFLRWAQRTGRIHSSPSGMLVHDTAGLFVSFRGALGLRERIEMPKPRPSPCETCDGHPCQTACPVGALRGDHYAVDLCKAHLVRPEGQDCLAEGCRARRACPVSQNWGRSSVQSAYHMKRFLEG